MTKFISSATKKDGYPISSKEIVFVGRSNVGKSSLINKLYGRVAYVGKTPGKTKLLNFFNVDGKYTVCDVPGYGYAKRSNKEIIDFGKMMDEYFRCRLSLKACIMILDIRRIPNNDDINMYAYLKSLGIKVLFVFNKCDKLSNNQRIKQVKLINEVLDINDAICISCLKGDNINIVAKNIESLIKEINE